MEVALPLEKTVPIKLGIQTIKKNMYCRKISYSGLLGVELYVVVV